MLKRISTAFAIATMALVLTTSTSAQPGKHKTRGRKTSPTITKSKPSSLNNAQNKHAGLKKPTHFIGGGDDGQGIRRKQPRNRQGNQAPTVQANPNPPLTPGTVAAKKPKHFTGGSDDGQSIRRKQPHRRRGQ